MSFSTPQLSSFSALFISSSSSIGTTPGDGESAGSALNETFDLSPLSDDEMRLSIPRRASLASVELPPNPYSSYSRDTSSGEKEKKMKMKGKISAMRTSIREYFTPPQGTTSVGSNKMTSYSLKESPGSAASSVKNLDASFVSAKSLPSSSPSPPPQATPPSTPPTRNAYFLELVSPLHAAVGCLLATLHQALGKGARAIGSR